MKTGKCIVLSAPSGSGKTTIAKHLLAREHLNLAFSVSATSRPPRGQEVDGKDYYFLSEAAFKAKIADGAFVEYEEVYPGMFYGTLKAEVDRIWALGKNGSLKDEMTHESSVHSREDTLRKIHKMAKKFQK